MIDHFIHPIQVYLLQLGPPAVLTQDCDARLAL